MFATYSETARNTPDIRGFYSLPVREAALQGSPNRRQAGRAAGVRVHRPDQDRVRPRRSAVEGDRLAVGVQPVPGRVADGDMGVADARRRYPCRTPARCADPPAPAGSSARGPAPARRARPRGGRARRRRGARASRHQRGARPRSRAGRPPPPPWRRRASAEQRLAPQPVQLGLVPALAARPDAGEPCLRRGEALGERAPAGTPRAW